MHVALLSPAWPFGRRPNGIVTYVHFMAKELAAQGHRVTVLSGDVGDECRDATVVRIWEDSYLSRFVRRASGRRTTVYDAWRGVARAIDQIDASCPIDVVEMEETFGLFGEVGRHVKPVVIPKLHGPGFLVLMPEEAETEAGLRRIGAEGRALATQQVMTAPSNWTLEQTLSKYALQPIIAEVIGNPIEAPEGLPLWNRHRCDAERVLFVGRFDLVKGGDVVIRAVALLQRRRPRLRLTFVGPDTGLLRTDGTRIFLADYVKSLGVASLEHRIDFLGPTAPDAIRLLRPQAAVTVVASRQESQGYTAMEAMLQACPLVCSDSSGLSELVEHEHTGLKARTEDIVDFSRQIERVLETPELGESLGRSARESILARHSSAAIVKQSLTLYERAIGLHSR